MTSSERARAEPGVPTLALTPGEPAGIGPDVVIAAAQTAWPARLVAVADPELLEARAAMLDVPLELHAFDPEAPARRQRAGTLYVDPVHCPAPVRPGRLDTGNARYVVDTLARATQGCLSGRYRALVTGPVQKSIINEAGVPFSGHTEFLAEQCGVARVVMLLAAEELRVALATTHLPLSAVPAAITGESLEQVLEVLDRDLRQRFALARPRITVLGLNPHAGESGHLGREEIDVITPALNRMRDAGLCLNGPLPADTAFNPDIQARTDAYLAMYHDQGLPVLKYAGFGQAVNITLGLPFVRTSVDHGTALPLAGRGDADSGSMLAAIRSALQMIAR